MTKEEALMLALEALENVYGKGKRCEAAIAAIKQALAQPEQKPVAWRAWFDADNGARWLFSLWPEEERLNVEWTPLYTTPPHRKPLTDEVVSLLYKDMVNDDRTKSFTAEHWFKAGVATGEAAHGIKE